MNKTKKTLIYITILVVIICITYNLRFYENSYGTIEKETPVLSKAIFDNTSTNNKIKVLTKGTRIRILKRIEEKEIWFYKVEEVNTKTKGFVYFVDVKVE